MPFKRARWAVLISALAGSGWVGAADSSLLDLELTELANVKISTASRHEQDISQAPAVVSVITRQDIERYGADNLFDVLKHFPGFLALRDPATGRSGLSLRGDGSITSERILTLIDGKPYRSVASEGFVVNGLYQTFPLVAVERIEVIRGPGSAMYGGTAVSGIVNIITRDVDKSGGEFNAQGSNHDAHGENMFVGIREAADDDSSDWTAALSGNHFNDGSWAVDGSNGFVPFNYSYPAKGKSTLFDVGNGNFYFKTLWSHMTNNYPQPTRLIENDDYDQRQVYYDSGYADTLSEKMQYDVHYSRLEIDDDNLGINDVEDLVESNLFLSVSDQTRFQTGFSFNKSRSYATKNFVSGIDDHPETRGGVYAQVDHELNEQWALYTGAQWNKESGGDSRLSPRLGAIYKYNASEGVKLLYNEAFRSPTAVESNMNITLTGLGLTFVDNPQLSSETVKTWDLQWFHYGSGAEYTLTAFYSQYDDRIQNQYIVIAPGPVVVTPGQFVQNSDMHSYGLEWEGKFHITPRDRIEGNVVWQHNKVCNIQQNTTLMPSWTASLGYAHAFSNKVEWSIFNQYADAYDASGFVVARPNPSSEDYHLLSTQITLPLTVGIAAQNGAQLFLRADNLLDERVWQPALTSNNVNTQPVEDGRVVTVGVKLRW